MRTYRFNREDDNKWYVDLPEWEGAHEELEMVLGADTMLDILSQGENQVRLTLSTEPFEGYKIELEFDREDSEGGWYNLKSDLFNFEVWLCHVTKFVFGELPQNIYIS